jgi:hypothetical protein
MRKNTLWFLLLGVGAVAVIAGVILLASGGGSPSDAAAPVEPSRIEHVEGSNVTRIVLSADGARRLDLQTAPVAPLPGGQRTSMPYAALLYDANGETWTYVRTRRLTFQRQPVVVDTITGDRVILTRGPAAGSFVVVVGSQELLGVESGVEDE